MNPLLGGALTALGWGGADFIARFTGGTLGYMRALFGMLGTSALVLTGIAWWLRIEPPTVHSGWWSILLSGLGVMLATMLLYHALVRGPITVVAPIVGSFPAFNIVIALLLGIRPTPMQWIAVLAVMLGGVVVATCARDLEHSGRYSGPRVSGTLWISLASAVLFALAVAVGQEAGVAFGAFEAVWLARCVSVACCALAFAFRREWPLIPLRWWPVITSQGILDGGAYLALLSASQGAGSALTAVVASTFSAVTVILARFIIKESMTWSQWGGIVLILVGVATLSWSPWFDGQVNR